ncbi:WxcM-like domain-containing protein [Ginsengibacter hankyongi]|uniref:WxcM-like domain-containing protein n=1 Tax=Ginsengibacter hankyongi TaxID=2607284 RepID=A0A5J5ING9_9BACT|nr:FdtA/QdtA family cupin domain-containing protein [Ginsengibacter hankyongi]KAA9041464.1 WxcM-like domain-containing protein [Ginsengibacter hankyongi]
MANLINLKTFTDARGNLTVIEKVIPFDIKRVFYIYGVDNSVRGHHRHKKTIQSAIAIQGECQIHSQSGEDLPIEIFSLNSPSKCLIINREDYHWMDNFSKDCILMVFASEYFDANDYIYEPYKKISR